MPAVPDGYTPRAWVPRGDPAPDFDPFRSTSTAQPVPTGSVTIYRDPKTGAMYDKNPDPKPTLGDTIIQSINHPIDAVGKIPVVKKAEDAVGSVWDTIEKDAKKIADGVGEIPHMLSIGFDDFKQGASWVYKEGKIVFNDVEQIGIVLFKTAEFIINHYKMIAIIGGVYIGARVYNEVKQVL